MGPLDKDNLLFNSGDYEAVINMGKLVDDDKDGVQFRTVVDLNDLYSNFSIHQSIFNHFMTLTIHINEARLITERFGTKGLQGEEFIQLSLKTPTFKGEDIIEDLFYVTGYSPITTDTHDLQRGMVLHCVSKEKLINDQVTVNQSFSGSTSEIATKIFNNHLLGEKYKLMKAANGGTDRKTIWKDKKLFVDESEGVNKFIIPGLTPFATMHLLARRSFGGSKYPGSLFSFYEASDGFHFKNIENWEEPPADQDDYTFDSDIRDLKAYDRNFFYNIRSMSPLVIKNTLSGIDNGEFATKIQTIDFHKKSFTNDEFNMLKEREKFNRLGEHFQMSSAFFKMFGKEPVESTIIVDSTTNSDHIPQIVARRSSYSQLLGHYSFSISVNGDSSLSVGKVIKLKLKEPGAPEKKPKGSMYSGNWLITECEHVCDRGLFVTRLTIVKDGLDFTHKESVG